MTLTATDMARDLRLALDPVAFAESIGLRLDDWQESLVRSTSAEIAVVAGRQTGKSTAAALKAVHVAEFEPRSITLAISPSLRQSKLLISAALDVANRAGIALTSETTTSLTLASGSEIVALPGTGSTIRGKANVRLLILDECAFVDDATIAAALPMTATNARGQVVMLSTPNGMNNHFSRVWHAEDGQMERYLIRADECDRISPAFLQRQRLILPASVYAQEFEGSFTDSAGSVFRADDIARMLDENTEAWTL